MIINKPLVVTQPQVGNLIFELRLETGLTQEQFAATLGVTYSTMNRWENGRSRPSPLAMRKVEEMLGQIAHGKVLLEKYLAEAVQSHCEQQK